MPHTFVDDDQGYLGWLERHPSGFVVNTYRTPDARYVVLHRATCGKITGTPARGNRWTADYAKVCSERRDDLEDWTRHTLGGELHLCGSCRP